MPAEKIEFFKSLDNWAAENILIHLKCVKICCRPQDFLPDPESDGFYDQVTELRERAKEIPNDYFVVLVVDMITEEALPIDQTMLNTLDGVRDETGRVDMKQVEKTIQYLIGSGMDPKTENSPYLAFIYTSFQERATFISHGNTARLAKEYGDQKLAQICGTIASDENCREISYSKIVEKPFELDPDGTVLALANLMKKKIAMHAHLKFDGQGGKPVRELHFCVVKITTKSAGNDNNNTTAVKCRKY